MSMKFKFVQRTPFLKQIKKTPKNFGGYARGMVMTINPKYINDEGLFYHELRHIQHWWICVLSSTLLLSLLIFLFNIPLFVLILSFFTYSILMKIEHIRFKAEIDCYSEQLLYINDNNIPNAIDKFSRMITTKYDLDSEYTKEMTTAALLDSLNNKLRRVK